MRVLLAACCAFLAACTANSNTHIAAAPGGHILVEQAPSRMPPPLPVEQTGLIDLGYYPVHPGDPAPSRAIRKGGTAPPDLAAVDPVVEPTAQSASDLDDPFGDEDVAYMQALLDQMGYAPGPIDGILGPLTQAAIDAFQMRLRLEPSDDIAAITAQLETARLVPEAQQLLTELGYVPGPIDGIPGPLTRAAMTAFQKRFNLEASGAVSDESLAVLRSAATLREIQIRLAGLGYNPGPADGILGPRTQKAILFFERDRGLPHMGWAPTVVRERLREAPYIEETQRLLAVLGYKAGAVTGRNSAETRAAIRAFQRDSNLPITGRASADLLLIIQSQARTLITPASGPEDNSVAAGPTDAEPNSLFTRLMPMAEEGAPSAQHLVAGLYLRGQGIPADLPMAVNWYEKAANQGFAPAQFRLGLLHAFGIGTDVDTSTAEMWFKQAAAHGHSGAASALAMLNDGLDPVDYPAIR